MSTVLKFRRGNTTIANAFTGAEGELFVDTTKDTLVVHDGVTAGGKPLATESYVLANIPSLTGYATESYVTTQISNLIDAAPTALNTLNELAAALNDDANFASTVTTSLAGKQSTLVSGTNIKSIVGVSLLGSGNIDIKWSDISSKPTLFDGAYSSLTGAPTLATVATTGSYNDLTNKPTLFSGSYNDLTDKPTFATESYVDSSLFIGQSATYNEDADYTSGGLVYFGFGSPGIYVDNSRFTSDPNVIRNVPVGTVFTFKTNSTGNSEYTFTTTGVIDGNNVIPGTTNITGVGAPSVTYISYSATPIYQQKLISGTNIKSINGQSLLGTGDITISGGGSSFSGSYNDLTDKPTSFNGLSLYNTNLTGPIILNGIVQDYFGQSQGTGSGDSILTSEGGYAVRWQNLKTINGNSIVGSGNITISGGSGGSSLTYGQFADNTVALTTTAANQVIDSFSAVDYRTSKYVIQAVCDGVGIHSTEVMIIHDGASVYISEYATIYTNGSLFTVDASIVGDPAQVEVTVTPTNANTTIDVVRTSLAARTFVPPSLEGDLMLLSGSEDLQTSTGSVDLNV